MEYQVRAGTKLDLSARPEWLGEFDFREDGWSGKEIYSAVLVGVSLPPDVFEAPGGGQGSGGVEAVGNDGTDSSVEPARERLLGVGMLWLPRLHRSHYELEVLLAPEAQNSQAVRALAQYLMGKRQKALPVMTRGYLGSPVMRLFDRLEVRTLQMVPPSRVEPKASTALFAHCPAVPASSVSAEALCSAATSMYLWTHKNWAPVGASQAGLICESLSVLDEADPEVSSVVVDGQGRVSALALVYLGDSGAELIAETTDPETPAGEDLVRACVKRSLQQLETRGIEVVDFDGHVSDRNFFPVWMTLSPSGDWFRILEVVKPGLPEG